jgi:hypothetical protein
LLSLLEALTCAPQGKSWNEQPPGGLVAGCLLFSSWRRALQVLLIK